jgi:predicted ATPase/class 3 adenylate cyclase/DNA-binding CsgD family transcriptional regulator
MLASVSGIGPGADSPLVDCSQVGVSAHLPTGTVTLLLADVEGSTRLWDTQPGQMTAAMGRLDEAVSNIIAAHAGVRSVEQGEGDSFVAAFAHASDAVAAALQLQRARLMPVRLRIGVHTGEVQLRDGGNYAGATINRTARLRDLAHGGQTVLSGTTEQLLDDGLPDDVWLIDLGTHPLRDLPRPERVLQLCHPDLRSKFPPLRGPQAVVLQHLPRQLTRFVGREPYLAQARELLAENRLLTVIGAGGVGKTRLALEVAAQIAGDFADGVWFVHLAPITAPEVVPVAAARAFGLPDRPGRSTMDRLMRFVADRQMLVVMDNCEHLLNACAVLVAALLGASPGTKILATSREPIEVASEVMCRVPSLSLADEAVELFTDRARHARPDFAVTDDDVATVTEICRRLDGLPLAIELAAARVRVLSVVEILDGLHDRFRLLTGGARAAVRRQQTLRASVDWSHALLTESERVLLRRLSVFLSGFDLAAAQAVAAFGDMARYHVMEQLALLVDKSLAESDHSRDRTRYRLPETVRQYGLEKLAESGEAEAIRSRHRDYYTSMAAAVDVVAESGYGQRLEQAEIEIDNLRAAFGWSRENSDTALALTLASSLQPLWVARGRVREGLAWFDAVLDDDGTEDIEDVAALRAQSWADKAVLESISGAADGAVRAQHALSLARGGDDPAALARALTACGLTAAYNSEPAEHYFAEATEVARKLDDKWRLSQILAWHASARSVGGDVVALRAVAEEGSDLAEATGNGFVSRHCRQSLGMAQLYQGDLAAAAAQFCAVAVDAEVADDGLLAATSRACQGVALAWQGDPAAALNAVEGCLRPAAEFGGIYAAAGYLALVIVALAAGDVDLAREAAAAAWPHVSRVPAYAALQRPFNAVTALASGDLIAARRWADDAVASAMHWHLMWALTTRARVAIAQGELERAERDTNDALEYAAQADSPLGIADTVECVAHLAAMVGSHREAVRSYGAAHAIRQTMGAVRFKIWDPTYEGSVAGLREALGQQNFDTAWAEGAALSISDATAYARRGRGGRKRPTRGWTALTPAEHDVVRLVGQGLANNEIAATLFVSPRTVQSHLNHVYTKLGLTSRVQLAQEASRRG